ncbi:MAG: hypothetical protein KJO07_20035 [Deltaproteobacteria bacterium]|nr:hypothetical protein [Deltaproteobacteria bacterium]
MRSWILVLAALALACGSTVSRAIPRAWIGTPKARLTTYLKAVDNVEDTPGSIRHDVIRDEAVLAKLGGGEVCFDVVVRTSSQYDEPFDQLEPTCGSEKAATESELVSVFDYTYTGQVEKLNVQGVAASEFVGLSISEPAEQIFRVIERKGRLCCVAPQGNEVELELTSPRMTYNNMSYSQTFQWEIR